MRTFRHALERSEEHTSMEHYDFIEIGTCDFATETQKAGATLRGLAVEPMAIYLERLPCKPTIKKVCAAVSERDGTADMFYITEETITKYGLEKSARGCNSIGTPHPTVLRWLTERGASHDVIKKTTVPMVSIKTLLENNAVGSIGYLKIDTEGHDCVILNAFLDYIADKPSLRPKRIRYESNVLSPLSARRAMMERLKTVGYTVQKCSADVVATCSDA